MKKMYFMHKTLSPQNVRFVIEPEDNAEVPPIGVVVRIPFAGLFGEHANWRVVDHEWAWVPDEGFWSITVHCTDVLPDGAKPDLTDNA